MSGNQPFQSQSKTFNLKYKFLRHVPHGCVQGGAFAVMILCAVGCVSTDRTLKVIDVDDAKRAQWAAPKTVFRTSERALVQVHGYGGHSVRLELWREPTQFVGAMNASIPTTSITRTDGGIGFYDSFGQLIPMRQEKVQWKTTDWHVTLGALPPGSYEVRLLCEGVQNSAAKFTVQPTLSSQVREALQAIQSRKFEAPQISPNVAKKLESSERELVGKWIGEGANAQPDETFNRISWLITHALEKVAVSKQWGEWETLYRDPADGRYWERTFPAGGSPSLTQLSEEKAKAKYGVSVER